MSRFILHGSRTAWPTADFGDDGPGRRQRRSWCEYRTLLVADRDVAWSSTARGFRGVVNTTDPLFRWCSHRRVVASVYRAHETTRRNGRRNWVLHRSTRRSLDDIFCALGPVKCACDRQDGVACRYAWDRLCSNHGDTVHGAFDDSVENHLPMGILRSIPKSVLRRRRRPGINQALCVARR